MEKVTKVALSTCLVLILFGSGLMLLYQYSTSGYEKSEKYDGKLTTSLCLSTEIAYRLNNFFKKNKSYPDKDSWASYIIESGYPGDLGCGPTSINSKDNIVDVFGSEFIYEYLASNKILIYSKNVRREMGTYYELDNGVARARGTHY